MSTQEFTIKIRNNRNALIPISILGNPSFSSTFNAFRTFSWDITPETFADPNFSIQIKLNAAPAYTTYGGQIKTLSIGGLVEALNFLNIGLFWIETSGSNSYIVTANDTYLYNELTIGSNTFAIQWTARTPAFLGSFHGVAFGNGLFVAVDGSVSTNFVMTSPDGINWTAQTTPLGSGLAVIFDGSQFVALSGAGVANQIFTSPDGINWTQQTTPFVISTWQDLAFGGGVYIAIGINGVNTIVMTSPDSVVWTLQASLSNINLRAITYANGGFVGVGSSAAFPTQSVATTVNGVAWTIQTASVGNDWRAIAFGNGVFVAVSNNGSGDRVMTSPDGVNWTTRSSAADQTWQVVGYGNGVFAALAIAGGGTAPMYSLDNGVTWTLTTSPPGDWESLTFGNGMFVAVAPNSTRVMTSP